MTEHFNPNNSQIGDKRAVAFIDEELDESLEKVPGIGKKAIELLKNCPDHIETSYQLLGKFLMLRKKGMTEQEHCDAMWKWLKSIGLNSHRSGIIRCLGLKLLVAYPNLFSASTFERTDVATGEEIEEGAM